MVKGIETYREWTKEKLNKELKKLTEKMFFLDLELTRYQKDRTNFKKEIRKVVEKKWYVDLEIRTIKRVLETK